MVYFLCPNHIERAALLVFCFCLHPLYDHGAPAWEKTSLVHREEQSPENPAQSLNSEPLLKMHSLQEAQKPRLEERTRVQSKRLEWFEEVGRTEVGLWGFHGLLGRASSLLQEVLRLGRQWKDEILQLEGCTSDSALWVLGHKTILILTGEVQMLIQTRRVDLRVMVPTLTSKLEPQQQMRNLFRGLGFQAFHPELQMPSMVGWNHEPSSD